MFNVGDIEIASPVIAAPMAGVSDLPYRRVCRVWGAGLAVSEMVTSRPELRKTRRSRLRMDHTDEPGPISVQIVGADPGLLKEAAEINVAQGADIIDINMGCPSKKVCKKMAGSALMADEQLIQNILQAVVSAVAVPVTLKIRTGINREQKNAVRVAQIAENCGVKMITVHGRSRACRFKGPVEYLTIADVVSAVNIPVIANGDIDSPEMAVSVIRQTGATGVMVGRAAMGQPWLFQEISAKLDSITNARHLLLETKIEAIKSHLRDVHQFYGVEQGVILARKHAEGYMKRLGVAAAERSVVNRILNPEQQIGALERVVIRAQTSMNLAA